MNALDFTKVVREEDVPKLSLKDGKLILVPVKNASIAGKGYKQGFEVGGIVDILDAHGELDLAVTKDGLNGVGEITPITVTIPGSDVKVLSITSVDSITKGPRIEAILTSVGFKFFLDGKIVIEPLNISSATKINMTMKNLTFKSTTQLFGKYESEIEGRADLPAALSQGINPDNFYLTIRMQQSLMSFLEQEITKFAQQLAPNFNRDAQKEFDRVEGEIARLDRELQEQYNTCMSPPWNWTHANCTLFWTEISRRNVERAGLITYRDAILKPGVAIAQTVVGGFSNLAQVGAQILGRGFNVESFVSTAKLSEFVQAGKLPHVNIKLKFLGKDVELKDMQFSFTDIPGSVANIFEQLKKLVI